VRPLPSEAPLSLKLRLVYALKPLEVPIRRHLLPDRFHRVEVETTTRCNHRCPWCPVSALPRPPHEMDEALYLSILDQLADMGFWGRFSPHWYGEPLLDDRLPRLVWEARRRLGRRATLVVYTRGDLLTPERAEALLDAGVDLFLVTIEDDLPEALARTKKALPKGRFVRRFAIQTFEDGVPQALTRGGLVRLPGMEFHPKNCLFASSCLIVDAWGCVKLCSNDYLGRHDRGDLRLDRLIDIWHKPENAVLRREVLDGKFRLPICRVCAGLEAATPVTTWIPRKSRSDR
jgi:hypothetical protein